MHFGIDHLCWIICCWYCLYLGDNLERSPGTCKISIFYLLCGVRQTLFLWPSILWRAACQWEQAPPGQSSGWSGEGLVYAVGRWIRGRLEEAWPAGSWALWFCSHWPATDSPVWISITQRTRRWAGGQYFTEHLIISETQALHGLRYMKIKTTCHRAGKRKGREINIIGWIVHICKIANGEFHRPHYTKTAIFD